MKNILVIVLLLLSASVLKSQSKWSWISAYPTGNYARSSCQSEGRVFYLGWPKTFFYTPDAGDSFNVISPYQELSNSMGASSIAFADSLNGFIIDEEYGVDRTTDGGKSWSSAGFQYYYFSLMAFGSKEVGWIFGDSFYFRTTDSGNTWRDLGNSWVTRIPGRVSVLYAPDQLKIWLCKSAFDRGGGNICFSADGGETWLIRNPLNPDSAIIKFNDIRINISGTGFVAGNIANNIYVYGKTFLFRTTNFGISWTSVPIDSSSYLNKIISKNDEEWIILGSKNGRSLELKTTDSGNSWKLKSDVLRRNPDSQDQPLTAEYIKSKNILLVSGYSGIYRSLDFGETFKVLSKPDEIYVRGFSIDNSSPAEEQLAVAAAGDSMIVSGDGGRSWQKKYYAGTPNTFFQDVSVSNGNIYAKIGYGIYKSTDKGDSWVSVYQPYYDISNLAAYKNSIAFSTNISSYPYLMHSEDGGDTWINSPFYSNCLDITMYSKGGLYAGGNYVNSAGDAGGYIISSNNHGYDWYLYNTEKDIKKVLGVNANVGVAISDYDLLRTSDKGKSWSKVRIYSNYPFIDVDFKDSLNGILLTSQMFYKSSDGGMNWFPSDIDLPFFDGLEFIRYNKFGDLIIKGAPGMCILKNEEYSPGGDLNNFPAEGPEDELLYQNYPNPFNGVTTIRYFLPNDGNVEMKVYDILGKEAAVLTEGYQKAGYHHVLLDGNKLSSGIYIYQLKSGSGIQTKKLILLK